MSIDYTLEMPSGGAPLSVGFGVQTKANARARKHHPDRNGNQNKPKIGLIVLAAVLVLASVLGAVAWQQAGQNEETVMELAGMTVLGSGFTDVAVVDESSAIEAAAEGSEQLGYENALDELSCYVSTSVDGQQYYRLQQHYQGIPVYGKYVMLVASDSGEALSLISYAQDIPDTISLKPSIDDEQAAEAIRDYAKFHWDEVYDDMTIPALTEEQLVIYDQTDEPRLAYCLTVMNGDCYEVVVDARNAQVLTSSCKVLSVTQGNFLTGTQASDSTVKFPIVELPLTENGNKQYAIGDYLRNIQIYNMRGYSSRNMFMWDDRELVTSVGNTVFGDTAAELAQDPEKAIDLYITIRDIVEYYRMSFGQEVPTGNLILLYNDTSRDNASGGMAEVDNMPTSNITLNPVLLGTEVDILAHEYTHCVQFDHDAAARGSEESIAIAEGLADTFAFFYTDDWDMDLTVLYANNTNVDEAFLMKQHRNAEKPWEYGYAQKITDVNLEIMDFTYAYSTVISHAAYEMYQSGCFQENELELLWYKTMISLPPSSSFHNFRECMEVVADLSGCTDRQKAVIAKVFDDAGITNTYGREINLIVFDKQQKPYDDFKIEVTGQINGLFGLKKDYSEVPTTNAGTAKLKLKEGTYDIKVTDLANNKEVVYSIQVQEESNATEMVVQYFGADYELAPGATLTVLDRNGEVYSDYEAYVYLPDKAELVEIKDGIVDLPVRNYYHFLLSDKSDCVTHYEFFTVRVKDGAGTSLEYQSKFCTEVAPTVTVSDAYTDAFAMDDGIVRCYHVPQIELEACADLNARLYETYYGLVAGAAYSAIGYGEYPIVDRLWYTVGQKGDVLSLVVHSEGWSYSCMPHNVSTVTGENLSAEQVLYTYGITEEEFAGMVASGLERQWNAMSVNMSTDMASSWALMKEQTLSHENIAAAIPFVGANGRLCFKADIFTLAGDGVVVFLADAQTGDPLEWTVCDGNHSDILRQQPMDLVVRITEEDAYQRACNFWGYEPEETPEGEYPEFSVALFDIENHGGLGYYNFYLRHLVTEDGYTWVKTLDIVYVDAVTGQCTYSPGD